MTNEDSAQSSDDPIIRDALESLEWLNDDSEDLSRVDEIDLAIVAERGLQAIPEIRRERVASYIAASPAAARAVLEARRASREVSETRDDETPSPLPIASHRQTPRAQGSGWWMAVPSAAAALIAVTSSIGWLNSQPTLEEQLGALDPGSGFAEMPAFPNNDEAPLLIDPGPEDDSQTDPGDVWRRTAITAGIAAVAFSPLLYIAFSRRSRRRAESTN